MSGYLLSVVVTSVGTTGNGIDGWWISDAVNTCSFQLSTQAQVNSGVLRKEGDEYEVGENR